MPVWKTFRHNGIAFPPTHDVKGVGVVIRGQVVSLSPIADEMAYNFAKKKDTPYVRDPVFVENFMKYFAKELPTEFRGVKYSEIDFSRFYSLVDQEKRTKEAMTKDEKKSLAASRKVRKEEMKGKYGKANIDGKEVEIANWLAEPPGLFMGRGCVAADTLVKTPTRPKYVQELTPRDLIASRHGSENMFYKPVAAVAEQGVRRVFQLRTRTHSIRATENHPFLSLNVNKVRRRNSDGTFTSARFPAALVWKPLSRLGAGDYVVTVKRYQTLGTSKYSNSPSRAHNGKMVVPKLARVLGYYLGDGFTTKRTNGQNSHVSFSEGHPKLVARYTELCKDVFGVTPVVSGHSGGNSLVLSVYSREVADMLESMGVTGSALTKRVPDWIFEMADDLKLAFLRGYLDADGNFFVNNMHDIEYGSFAFESTNKRLIEDVRELSISAGLQVSNISTRANHGYGGRSFRFFINEYRSVIRLLDPEEALRGPRTRNYSLDERSRELRRNWDWSRLKILDSALFGLERVLEISDDGSSLTYDVSMRGTASPNFIANGFVVHNSHPLRGSWKPRVEHKDVVLNLDESSPVPQGAWKAIVHDRESIWIAKWTDKLTGKEKYVWPHESSEIQQSRNKEKYDKALRIGGQLEKLRRVILKAMSSKDARVSKTATVCYLIDRIGMRVGDEKDEDEADTVGATTLRVEHIKIGEKSVEFDFLGKDSVRWTKVIDDPGPILLQNLRKFTAGKKPGDEVFDVVTSSMVNQFLSRVVVGASAKVFRTYHASVVTEKSLRSRDVRTGDELEKLYFAKEANLAAAIFCNHKRTPPKNWDESLKKKEQKLEEYKAKGREGMVRKMSMNVEFTKKTKDYNLNTSLKNYIDPRIYKSWSEYAGLDWGKLYTTSMQRKFSWVAKSRRPWSEEQEQEEQVVTVKQTG